MDNETSAQEIERKEKPLNDLLTSSMVSIYVGPENTHWYIHERLLCYYSPFFSEIFYADDKKSENQKARRNKAYGLSDEEDLAFEMLVGWLYSRDIKVPKEEKDLGPLLDLYLLSEKLRMDRLSTELVEAISDYYYQSKTYPSLRRVQHIYANTDDDNEMREMMVGSVAKLLTTSDKIPAHWASALQRNGQLAVDIIRSIQQWKLEEKSIPDARDRSSSRGRSAKNGFSAIERQGTESMETEKTSATSNLGVESLNSEGDRDQSMQDSQILRGEKSEASEASPPPDYSNLSTPESSMMSCFATPNLSPNLIDPQTSLLSPKRPPDTDLTPATPTSPTREMGKVVKTNLILPKRRLSVTFSDKVTLKSYTFFPSPLATGSIPTSDPTREYSDNTDHEIITTTATNNPDLGLAIITTLPPQSVRSKSDSQIIKTIDLAQVPLSLQIRAPEAAIQRPEAIMLGLLWMLYLGWLATN